MPQPPDWSPEEKFTAVLEAAALTGPELESFFRRRGLRPAQVEQWRNQMLAGLCDPCESSRSSALAEAPTPVAATPLPGADSPSSFLARTLGAIDENLADEEFQVGALAVRLAMSRSLLYQRLQDLGQPSPAKLILERRLARTAELLAQGDGSVSEIAYAAGFASASHFTYRFRQRFGVPPSAYRCGRGRSGNLPAAARS